MAATAILYSTIRYNTIVSSRMDEFERRLMKRRRQSEQFSCEYETVITKRRTRVVRGHQYGVVIGIDS